LTSSTVGLSLRATIDTVRRAAPPLLLVVGLERPVSQALQSLADDLGVAVLPLGRLFAEQLADLTPRDRSRRASRLFQDVLRSFHGPLTIIDRTAVLFLPDLMLNPLQLLAEASRAHGTLIAAWCGAWDGTVLTYARPGHPEYQRYAHPVATVVAVA